MATHAALTDKIFTLRSVDPLLVGSVVHIYQELLQLQPDPPVFSLQKALSVAHQKLSFQMQQTMYNMLVILQDPFESHHVHYLWLRELDLRRLQFYNPQLCFAQGMVHFADCELIVEMNLTAVMSVLFLGLVQMGDYCPITRDALSAIALVDGGFLPVLFFSRL